LRITRIRLKNFRCYAEVELKPREGVTALFGDNAQGKTSLLEAVALCCTGRSHRTTRDRELLRISSVQGYVCVEAERTDGPHEVEITLSAAERKAIKVNGSVISRSGELMGHVNGVMFAPEDLRMVKDGPSERRRFADMELSQISPMYYYALQRYNRALNQRNHLLREMIGKPSLRSTLTEWDGQLAANGAEIMRRRRGFLEKIGREARANHHEISGGREDFSVRYRPSVDSDADGVRLVEDISEALYSARETDARRMTTTVGPHRDDVELLLSGLEARVFASQGQQRTAALSLKLSELSVMKDETGEWPVLMLDDVMSELDPTRRALLLARLKKVQTFITCTDPNDLSGAEAGYAYKVINSSLIAADWPIETG
jgi:DNA replication and repair protein RecF